MHITQDITSVKASPTILILLEIFESTTGSNIAPVSFKLIDTMNIFIIGYTAIKINIKTPKVLITLFIAKEQAAKVLIASEKALPTTGIKLSIANFMLFLVTASNVFAVIPLIPKIVTKIIKINP